MTTPTVNPPVAPSLIVPFAGASVGRAIDHTGRPCVVLTLTSALVAGHLPFTDAGVDELVDALRTAQQEARNAAAAAGLPVDGIVTPDRPNLEIARR